MPGPSTTFSPAPKVQLLSLHRLALEACSYARLSRKAVTTPPTMTTRPPAWPCNTCVTSADAALIARDKPRPPLSRPGRGPPTQEERRQDPCRGAGPAARTPVSRGDRRAHRRAYQNHRRLERYFFQVRGYLDARDWVLLRAIRRRECDPTGRPRPAAALRSSHITAARSILDAVLPYLLGRP